MAAAVNLLYGAAGRQVHDGMLHAYDRALADATDYQLERGTDYLLRYWLESFPPVAAEVRRVSLKYEPSERQEQLRLEHTRRAIEAASRPRISSGNGS